MVRDMSTPAHDLDWVENYRVVLAKMDPAVNQESDLHYPTERLIRTLVKPVRMYRDSAEAVGRPDLKVCTEGERVIGWVELKHMDKSADPRQLRGEHDQNQWRRFQTLPNLVYSNGLGASLWRDGTLTAGPVHVNANPDQWASLWEEFLAYTPTVDSAPEQLAKTLGRRVKLLRDAVEETLDGGNDFLVTTLGLWRDHLLPDLTEKAFVDNYAQMAMAGLLLARGLQPDIPAETFGLPVAQQILRNSGYGTLAELVHHIDTAADPEAAVCLSALTDAAAALDPSVPSDDKWWADFYEAFLNEYDRKLKNDMGVFYTPKEIVDYQIRATDWALRNHLDLREGFVTEDVVTLDPACGTGTYLTRLIEHVAGMASAGSGHGAVSEAVHKTAQSVYGFEIMAAPYTVARMRLVAKCAGHGVRMDPDRVLLTDTLSASGQNRMVDMFARHMAERASQSKSG